jgi:alkylation response protein AidB-like acyl-CoA dehydrogenase
MIGAIMTHDAAVLKTRDIARRVLAPFAGQNDKAGRFSTEAVESLRESGLVGLLLPVNVGGAGLGPPKGEEKPIVIVDESRIDFVLYTIALGAEFGAHVGNLDQLPSLSFPW